MNFGLRGLLVMASRYLCRFRTFLNLAKLASCISQRDDIKRKPFRIVWTERSGFENLVSENHISGNS